LYGLLIDLDGTLYHGGKVISLAPSFIQKLREDDIPFLFVTNNSSRTPQDVANHLNKLGIEAREEEVCTSALATAQYIVDQALGKTVYLIGEKGLKEALKEKGLRIIEEEEGEGQFEEVAIDLVVQGIDRQFNYVKLTKATQFIAQGAAYLLTNPDHLLPSDELPIPGAGSIAAAIEKATGTQPTIIGKPSPIIIQYAIDKLLTVHSTLKRENIIVVGDNIHTDIQAGKNANLKTAFVLSGISKMEELKQYQELQPDIIANDLLHLEELLKERI